MKTFTLAFFNFFEPFILYVNGNKKRKYEIALHQKNKNENEKSILFLSRSLSDAENRYWATKLKTEIFV